MGEVLIQLHCNHNFHVECITDQALAQQNCDLPVCCVCTGPFLIKRRFKCLIDQIPSPRSQASAQSAPAAFLWYPAPDTIQPEGCFYGKTELKDGSPACLIDPGAYTSAAGELSIRRLAVEALRAGYKSSETSMPVPLKISGVGDGVQTCKWQCRIPVAIPTEDGSSQAFDFETPIVGGSGKHLPIILGLKSMSAKKSVLEMEEGKEFLSFPGPGGYKVEWSPGTVRIPLRRAMSGHLMAPLVAYDQLKTRTGVIEEKQVLHATQASTSNLVPRSD